MAHGAYTKGHFLIKDNWTALPLLILMIITNIHASPANSFLETLGINNTPLPFKSLLVKMILQEYLSIYSSCFHNLWRDKSNLDMKFESKEDANEGAGLLPRNPSEFFGALLENLVSATKLGFSTRPACPATIDAAMTMAPQISSSSSPPAHSNILWTQIRKIPTSKAPRILLSRNQDSAQPAAISPLLW